MQKRQEDIFAVTAAKHFATIHFYHDLRKDEHTIDLALKMPMKGMSIEAIADVLEVHSASVKRWLARTAEQCDKVNENMMKKVEMSSI